MLGVEALEGKAELAMGCGMVEGGGGGEQGEGFSGGRI